MRRSILATSCMGLALGLGLTTGTLTAEESGALYTMDNAAAGNHVIIAERDETGQLNNAGSIETGGAGTGAPQGLPSQGSVLLSRDGRWLFVCNAGSGEISVLKISPDGLTVTDKVASGGRMRIPTKADTCSNPNRTRIPIDIGQLSERSDALGSVIKKCPI